ncbi:MAG: hypothetical protein PUH18_02170 [Coriobacteriaceae bacterium]|nr:hypothetical protein [Coriobacteriaceae bacterium]
MIQVEPPRDAEGREIPLSTKVLYKQDGEKFNVESFDYWPKYKDWFVRSRNEGIVSNIVASSVLFFPPDSWEQLEHDATLAPRNYLQARGLEEQKDGRIATMMSDLVSRAKALAEREKRND